MAKRTTTKGRQDFAQRVRELMSERRMTQAELAEKAELAPSLVSKLLTESEGSRRDPRVEHILALARAFELTPGLLVAGTTAAGVLSDWIPRIELEAESKLRAEAQSEAARLRTELAGICSEAQTLGGEVERLAENLAKLQGAADHAARESAVELARLRAQVASALEERDTALEQARVNYSAWASVKSHAEQLQRDLRGARKSADTAKALALIGTFGGIVLGSAAKPPRA